MKKIISLVLVLISVAMSSLACFAKAEGEAKDKIIPKAKVEALTVLGDSLATGYGLDGYDAASDNAGILSYANLVAAYYGLTLGESYFNYAKDGATSDDLLKKLSSELPEEEYNNIAKSDVIVISIGGNDLLELLLTHVKEFLKLDQSATLEQTITKLSKMTKDELKDFEKRAKDFYKSKEKDFKEALEKIDENISSACEKLREIAPKAQIYVQSIYNPVNELPKYTALSIVNEQIISKSINVINNEIFGTAREKKMYVIDVFSEFMGRKENCTNIASFDVHPSQYGHAIIADAVQVNIDNVYDVLANGSQDEFSEGKFTWIWFAVAAVVVVAAIPVTFFVVKKSSGIKE
jgi:lysophospholipase L1-like esterase